LKIILAFFLLITVLILNLESSFRFTSHDWLVRYGHLHHTARALAIEIPTIQQLLEEKYLTEPEKITLDPEVGLLGNVRACWQLPSNPNFLRGLYLLFHGCGHDPEGFFQLQEQQKVVRHLLGKGYAVLALSSNDRSVSRCWSDVWPAEINQDLVNVLAAIQIFNQDHVPPFHQLLFSTTAETTEPQSALNLPLFAFGTNSGAAFVTLLGGIVDQVKGIVVQNNPGFSATFNPNYPPVVFIAMEKDTAEHNLYLKQKEELLELGMAVIVLSCKSKRFTPLSLSQALENFPEEFSQGLFQAMDDAGYLRDCISSNIRNSTSASSSSCFISQNPKPFMEVLGEQALKDLAKKLNLAVDLSDRARDVGEVLGSFFEHHEFTSEHVEVWEAWLFQQYLEYWNNFSKHPE